ncbi:hypothetical protein AB0395_42425 [Streptosporangium sp. NPDC051023]|uniref:hypothetical protein n=1 Tax=Streptosporangium sp. NPDC051023 TaxID=3155410 RepID=UPI00344DF993
MTTMTKASPAAGRLRTAWRAAHTPVAGVPRWTLIAAYAIPFTVLPSGLWRIAGVTFHLPLNAPGFPPRPRSARLPSWLPEEIYVILMSVASELLAFAAIGLVAAWGEVFPRWIVGLRGRRVPPLAAVVPATIGAVVLTGLWTFTMVSTWLGRTLQGDALPPDFPLNFRNWQGVLAIAAYVPLLAWGPLLALVTVAYHHRRTRVGGAPA